MTIVPWAHKLLKATSHEKDFFRILPIETVLREQGVSYSIPYVHRVDWQLDTQILSLLQHIAFYSSCS